MDFREATDRLMGCGVTLPMIAKAAGVSENSIARARTSSGQRRSPPKGWHRVVSALALEVSHVRDSEAAILRSIAVELGDA